MNPATILNKFLVWLSISSANQRIRVPAQTASVIGEQDLPDPIESFRRFEAA
jgi:hypothetical protein